MPTSPPLTRRIGFFAIAALGLLAAAELSCRLLVPTTQAERARAEHIRASLRFLSRCAEVEDRADERMAVGQQVHNAGGAFVVPLVARPGTTRIAFVGESTGVMLAGAAHELLARAGALDDGGDPKPAAARAFELLNCAESGSALAHVERRVREVLALDPDVVVLVFGHNWMMPAYPMDERVLRLRALLARSRLVSVLASAFPQGTPEQPPLDDGERARRTARLEDLLRGLAAEARRRGAAVVVTTSAANHRFPPFATPNAAGEPRLLEAALAYARGERGDAVRALVRLLEERPEPYWHYVLGSWLARRGKHDGAARHLQAAIDLQRREVDRATSTINDLVRRVAAEEGFVLRDLEAEVRRASPDGLAGWGAMRDHCHPLPAVVRAEAAALLAAAAESAGVARPAVDPEGWPDDDAVAYVLDGLATIQGQLRDERAARYRGAISAFVEHWARADAGRLLAVLERFSAGPVLAGMGERERARVLVAVAEGLAAAGRNDDARRLNERARSSGDADAWVQLGLFEAGSSPASARAAFQHALTVAPGRADAALFLARLAGGGSGESGAPGAGSRRARAEASVP